MTPRSLLLAALAIACAGCSRLSVEWTPGKDEIAFVARGPRDADLVVVAGPPNGPHVMAEDLSIWTTVGPDKPRSKGGTAVAQAPFDAEGVARGVIRNGPGGRVLLQAVAISRPDYPRTLAASGCVAVSFEDGVLRLRPHWVDAIVSRAGWTVGGCVAVAALALLLRRRRLAFIRSATLARRGPLAGTVCVLAAAAVLVAVRVLAPASLERPQDRPPPLFRGAPSSRPGADPLDAATQPGMRALVDGVRKAAPPAAKVRIIPASTEWSAWAPARQAAWLLWPVRVEFVERGPAAAAGPGVFLTFDAALKPPGARVLFENAAGSLWSAPEAPK